MGNLDDRLTRDDARKIDRESVEKMQKFLRALVINVDQEILLTVSAMKMVKAGSTSFDLKEVIKRTCWGHYNMPDEVTCDEIYEALKLNLEKRGFTVQNYNGTEVYVSWG